MRTALIVSLFWVSGCSSTLETGYKPRTLGASSTERRSYYASPFTPAASAADEERGEGLKPRTPRPGT